MNGIKPDQGTTGQIALGTNALQIVNGRKGRSGVKITNLSNVDVYLGYNGSVTNQSGDLLIGTKGAWIYIETESPIWGVGVGASVSWMELI